MGKNIGRRETLYLILYSVIGQVASSILILTSKMPPEIEFTAVESIGLSLAYTLAIFAITLLILYLLRRKLHALLMLMFIVSFALSTTAAFFLVADRHNLNPLSAVVAGLALTLLAVWENPLTPVSQSVAAGVISYVIVQLTGTTFPMTMIVLLSLYDIYTVYKGPLRKIIAETSSQKETVENIMTPIMVKTGKISVGMGDILAYTLAAAISYQSLRPLLATLNIAAMYVGIAITVSLVKRWGYVPGLPAPVWLWLSSHIVLSTI